MATILIVDDLAADREFLLTLLRSQGHRVGSRRRTGFVYVLERVSVDGRSPRSGDRAAWRAASRRRPPEVRTRGRADCRGLCRGSDREHQLLTDINPGRAGAANRQRPTESADRYRSGALVRAGSRSAVSAPGRGRARSVWSDLRHARHRRSERRTMQRLYHLWSGRVACARRRAGSRAGEPVPGLFRPVVAERRTCAVTILAAIRPDCSCRCAIRKSRPTSPRRSRR